MLVTRRPSVAFKIKRTSAFHPKAIAGVYAQLVHFHVALTVKEGTGTKGGIGVASGIVNLGSTGQSSNENTVVNHVKFAVPLALPHKGKR